MMTYQAPIMTIRSIIWWMIMKNLVSSKSHTIQYSSSACSQDIDLMVLLFSAVSRAIIKAIQIIMLKFASEFPITH